MATKTATTTRKTTTKKATPAKSPTKKAAPREVEDTAPAKKGGVQEVTFGVSDLVALVKKETGKDTTTRELRTLLRKMARDGRIDREIVAGNRARYDWSGPEDPEVQAALEAFKGGELEQDKQEKLAALKERKAAQQAAKKAAKEAEEADEEEDEDLELEDEDAEDEE